MSVYKKIESLSAAGTLPHAVIFEGEDRRAAAQYFSKCVVCGENDKPCGECSNCLKADKNIHPDIIELHPSGKMMAFPIEEIRRVKEDAFVLPNEARAKVYIFNDVDNISVVSQNALLKILEEPPKSVVFVLTCKSKTHLLDTIISRATLFYTSKADDEDDADLSEAFTLIKTAIFESELELLVRLNSLSSDREKRIKTIGNMQTVLRKLYRVKCGVEQDEEYSEIVQQLTVKKILKAIDITESVRAATLRNKSVKLTIALFCARLKSELGR